MHSAANWTRSRRTSRFPCWVTSPSMVSSSARPSSTASAPTSMSWRASTTAGSSRSASGTSSRRRSTPSSRARRASTASSRRWPPSTPTRARASGAGRTPPAAAGRAGERPMAKSAGKVRAARLTDLAALGELSRLAQADGEGTRSLGLPVSGPPIGVFSLFRLPLGAFTPHDVMYVYDRGGHIAGLLRVERESSRDEWTVVELDAVGDMDAGDVRFRLVPHLLPDRPKRGAVRFHVACADADDNVELFMQAGFVRFGDERVLFRDPGRSLPEPMTEAQAADCGIRTVTPQDALALSRLYASVTPSPVQRLESVRLPDWERQGRDSRGPRRSPAPLPRFAGVEAHVQPAPAGGQDGTPPGAVLPGGGG